MKNSLTGHRLEIFFRDVELDTRGRLLRDKLNALELSVTIENIWLSEVYTLEGEFSHKQLNDVAALLLNPVIHDVLIDLLSQHPVLPLAGVFKALWPGRKQAAAASTFRSFKERTNFYQSTSMCPVVRRVRRHLCRV